MLRRHLLLDDLRQVHHRLAFLALVALHQGIAPAPLAGTSRPSSRESTRSARCDSRTLWVTTTTAVS